MFEEWMHDMQYEETLKRTCGYIYLYILPSQQSNLEVAATSHFWMYKIMLRRESTYFIIVLKPHDYIQTISIEIIIHNPINPLNQQKKKKKKRSQNEKEP